MVALKTGSNLLFFVAMETLFLPLLAAAPESDRKDLLSELELIKKLKPHPHVIKLIGCVTKSGKQTI